TACAPWQLAGRFPVSLGRCRRARVAFGRGRVLTCLRRWPGPFEIVVGAIAIAACSSGSSGSSNPPPPSGTVTSSEPGDSFDAQDAAAWIETATLQGVVSAALQVDIVDKRGLCAIQGRGFQSLAGGRL